MCKTTVMGLSFFGKPSVNFQFTICLSRYATRSDPETGEERIDHAKAACLEDFMQRSGLSPHSAIAAWEANVQAVRQRDKSLSQEAAELMAQDQMRRQWGGGPALPPVTATPPPAGTDTTDWPENGSRLHPQAAGGVRGVLGTLGDGNGLTPPLQ